MGLAKFLDINRRIFYHIGIYERVADPCIGRRPCIIYIVEMITGRKPSDKFIEYAQMVGMVLLLGLMAYAFGLDIWRLFK